MKKKIVYLIRPQTALGLYLSLGVMAVHTALLEIKDITTKLFDLNFVSEEHLIKCVKKDKPHYIFFSVNIDTISKSIIIAKKCKDVSKDSKIVFGGPHITLIGVNLFNISDIVDIIVVGEAENLLEDLLEGGNTSGVIYREDYENNNNSFNKKNINYVSDLNTLPIPILPNNYTDYFSVIPIQTSRGCPYNCPFCAESFLGGRKKRFEDVEKTITKLKFYINKYKINFFRFVDSTFTCPPQHLVDVAESIIRNNMNVNWSCFARADTLDNDLLKIASEAGCKAMFLGIESGDENILKSTKKRINLSELITLVEQAKHLKIHIHANFIIGLPQETMSSVENTKEYIIKLQPDSVYVGPLYIIPQTEFHINHKKWGIEFLDNNWISNLHNYFEKSLPYFRTQSMTQQEMSVISNNLRNYLESKGMLWDLTDSKLLAWLSLGGKYLDIKKIWNVYDKLLPLDRSVYFRDFKEETQNHPLPTQKRVLWEIARGIGMKLRTNPS